MPQISDVAVWAQRGKNGRTKLTVSAIADVGKMPAHGGQPTLSDLEISRAVTFMASSGKAADPTKPYAIPSSVTGEELVKSHCVNCHSTGIAGAPRTDDFNARKPPLEKGMDGLVRSAITEHQAIPACAGTEHLSDTDLGNAVAYMVVQSATNVPPTCQNRSVWLTFGL